MTHRDQPARLPVYDAGTGDYVYDGPHRPPHAIPVHLDVAGPQSDRRTSRRQEPKETNMSTESTTLTDAAEAIANSDAANLFRCLGTDHQRWAAECGKAIGVDDATIGTLEAWFANAMCAEGDSARRRTVSATGKTTGKPTAVRYRSSEQDGEFACDSHAIHYAEDGTALVQTPDGGRIARTGDWIVRDCYGDYYVLAHQAS